MVLTFALLALAAASLASTQETVLGVYIFARHGDRTAKSTPPANLTDLGYAEVFETGTYYRNRYIASDATYRIHGINSDLVKQSQIVASAPQDTVLQNSALGFLQGLYPPVGNQLGSSTLRNGSTIKSPLNGYQLIPLQTIQTGSNSEDATWLQGATACANAQISSNAYFTSPSFSTLNTSTLALYQSTLPMINRTFPPQQATYQNAYAIWDLLNVASIHNTSNDFPASSLLTPSLASTLFHLANTHEFHLAYNASSPVRAVAGAVLAAQVVDALNATISSQSKSKQLNVQFGAYAGMLSFFGLANLTAANPDFMGIPDYASTLVWELVTNASVTSGSYPSVDEVGVRFLFRNGTAAAEGAGTGPVAFPLFGQERVTLPWREFVEGMGRFSVGGQAEWCRVCGNSTGVCAASDGNGDEAAGNTLAGGRGSGGGGGISKVVAGVIGAMVTLVLVLGVELLVMLVAGLRVIRKRNARGSKEAMVSQTTMGGAKA